MSTIFGIWAMPTGQASMQAAQVVQAHNESAESAGVTPITGWRNLPAYVRAAEDPK